MKTVASFAAIVTMCALVGACSDGPSAPSATTVTNIVVSAPAPSLQVGATMTATARLINSKGDDVASKTPTWSTSSAAVATVDQKGLITAVAPGAVTITAQADNAKGTLPLTVDVDRCANPLTLAVGQVSVLSGPAAVSCITLASSAAASQLLFITANANPTPDDKQTFAVSLQNGTVASVSPAASVVSERPLGRIPSRVRIARAARQHREPHSSTGRSYRPRDGGARRNSQ